MSAETELYERLVDLLGAHDVHPADRAELRAALDRYHTWDALPPDIKATIEALERDLPRESWADPMDMPDTPDDLRR